MPWRNNTEQRTLAIYKLLSKEHQQAKFVRGLTFCFDRAQVLENVGTSWHLSWWRIHFWQLSSSAVKPHDRLWVMALACDLARALLALSPAGFPFSVGLS
jgi:hypothetical protein